MIMAVMLDSTTLYRSFHVENLTTPWWVWNTIELKMYIPVRVNIFREKCV
ncbi:hypothetical protein BRDCF_p1459 [Bacteroidales bacterium CF]|nr:hypothetical protein BRDCF_p1459 [Bacteroidales bacterium CF]